MKSGATFDQMGINFSSFYIITVTMNHIIFNIYYFNEKQ